jgi:hypothetical protein
MEGIAMRRVIRCVSVIIILAAALAQGAEARKLALEPARVATITSPEETRDERVLIYFELPEKLEISKTQIDYAKLVFTAQVTDASMGQIEVYPVTTSWATAETPDWSESWTKAGGDYSEEITGKHLTIRSSDGEKSARCDVTFVVLAWLEGRMDNHGFILVPSQEDLESSGVEYSIETKGIELVIGYSLD